MRIFDFWNSISVTKHTKLTDVFIENIKKALKENTEEEIKQAIENYFICLKDQNYYFSYNYALGVFLKKQKGKDEANYKRFLNDGDIWQDYQFKKNNIKQPQDNYVKPKTDRIDLKKMNYDNVYEQIYGTES